MGYPTAVGNKKYVWNKGKLTRIYDDVDENDSASSEDIRFTYNAYGQRISKTYSYDPGEDYSGDFMTASTTTYTYDGRGRLIREYCTESYYESDSKTRELIYLYDESGVMGVLHSLNGAALTTYYYRRNPQGDVTAIYTTTGTRIGEYAYDAFGNYTILYGSSNDLVKNNPILYRGYYYDREAGLYYLNARYYNPQWRRFVSPDDTAYLDPESVNGLNLYAYCGNDPVNYADPSGNFAISTSIAVGFWIGLTIGALAGATAGGIVSYNAAKDNGAEGWELFAWTMLGIGCGGVVGGVVGAALGSSVGYGVGLIWGSAPLAGSQGAIALWSGGKGLAGKAAASFASKTGAKLVIDTFAGKTLNIVSKILPRKISNYLWGKLSAEFVAGASSATIFLFDGGISHNSTFYEYEIWVLLEKEIERTIHFVVN